MWCYIEMTHLICSCLKCLKQSLPSVFLRERFSQVDTISPVPCLHAHTNINGINTQKNKNKKTKRKQRRIRLSPLHSTLCHFIKGCKNCLCSFLMFNHTLGLKTPLMNSLCFLPAAAAVCGGIERG